tara:strand:- start:68 stop:280 length:213 start_codon:yes stop_codon:yes gene_type:complete
MLEMSDRGWTSKEISKFMNDNNIKTVNGLDYYPKLVWVSLFKYKRRLKRFDSDEIESITEGLYVTKIRGS